MAQEAENSEDYTENKVDYLVGHLKENKRELKDFDYQISSNAALVYIMDNKKVVLLPGNLSMSENGLILKNESVLKKMIEDDFFPIGTNETEPLEKYSEKFKNLPDNVKEFISFLENTLEIDISTVTEFDDGFFDDFDDKIKNCDLDKRKHEFFVPLTILLGEIIIKNKKGHWKVTKEYSLYNPYYHPVVVMNGIELDVTERIMSDLENPEFYSLKQSYLFLTDPRINLMLNPNLKNIYNDFLNNNSKNNPR